MMGKMPNQLVYKMVPRAGLEPARHKPRDFKSLASTDFATWAGPRQQKAEFACSPSGGRKDSTAPAAWAEVNSDIWRVTDWQFNGLCVLSG